MACIAVISLLFYGCCSTRYVRGAEERPYDLWMPALKGFEGPVYYVGSEGEFSYFRAGSVICSRYKAQTLKLRLPNTFPIGMGEPYRVTEGMVPRY
jgi:hypothetical protein